LDRLLEAAKYGVGEYVLCDISTCPFHGDQFDAVVLHQVLEHFSVNKRKSVLENYSKLLKPKGCLILSTVIKGPLGFLSRLRGRNTLGTYHKAEYASLEEIIEEVNNVGGSFSLLKVMKSFVRVSLYNLKIPFPFYYQDVYLVFKRN
jgi:2-polyprenyl-3-methyl-5-hydroxy-6-metoxy-1,4-benzoquinol methylase